jgi:tellurite resistance protein
MGTVRPPPVASLDVPVITALVEVLMLSAWADGEFSQAERAHLDERIQRLSAGRLDALAIAQMRADIAEQIALEGRDARLAAVRRAFPNPSERKVALAHAVRMAAADGVVRTSEREFLTELADVLELNPEDAVSLVRALTRG